ncbi:YidC/Oxa1 family membrane protein insertase [Luteipulveratus mongoliensis]|nr:YidC/Oxa1 family membrane protein insertase [Luteipulveratus mongoliensis]
MPAGLAVVALTVVIRAALHPLVRHAFRASRDGRAGCLPILVQIPIVSAVYRLFTASVIAGHANALLAQSFLGVPLGQHLLASAGPDVLVFLVLAVAIAAVAWGAYRFSRRTTSAPVLPDGTSPEVAAAMARTARLLPALSFGSVLAVAVVPLAASVYLLTSTAWSLAERMWLHHTLSAVSS